MTAPGAVATSVSTLAERSAAAPPALSVVLFTPGGYDEIRTTMRHLAVQTIVARVEVLIVAERPAAVAVPAEVTAPFQAVRLVAVPELRSLAAARALAVPQAAARFVAFAEDHSFPEPGWAEALVAAHARGYAGVAPQMKNANPASLLSWVAMFLHFAGTVEPAAGFEADHPAASHNMSYGREELLALGDELGWRLLAEGFLHDALRERGHRLWVEPGAATRHVNLATLGGLLRHAWYGGRLYGALRWRFERWWSLPRRLVYAGGSPLIPWMRLRRTVHEIRRAGHGGRMLPAALPPMLAILSVHAAGEAAGYLFGLGPTVARYSELEVGRDRFVPAADRDLWS